MTSQRLYKKEKLCSVVAISKLFSRDASVCSALAFPLRAVWAHNPGRKSDAPVQFLVSIPKRKIRKAVDRVLMRRRVREAYRLSREHYPLPEGTRIDLAFIYVDGRTHSYGRIQRAVCRLLEAVGKSLSEDRP